MPDISTPNISKGWRDDFIIAMRTQDASGEQIGDALATVDAHCAESGESAEEAFGDPKAYATTLVPEPVAGSGLGASFLVGVLMGLLGLLIVPRAVDDWVTGSSFAVTIGDAVALAVGAVSERGRMFPCVIFMFVWSTLVYDPIACWTWNPNGWSYRLGGLDFAGGTPVHISSGTAALAYSYMLGKRSGHGTHALNYRPHNVTHIVIGTVFLWVG